MKYYPFTHVWDIMILSFYKHKWDIIPLHISHKWQSYDVWFLRYQARWTEVFVILDHFVPFYPPNNPNNQNFEMKKTPGDIIILHKCTINDNHMIYGSWDMKHDRQNRTAQQNNVTEPLTTQKVKFWKTEKTTWRYHLLHRCTKNNDYMLYSSLDMTRNRFNCYFSFWAIFCHFIP